MRTEDWDELVAQVETHGPESVVFELETDEGYGTVWVTEVLYTDGKVKVRMA